MAMSCGCCPSNIVHNFNPNKPSLHGVGVAYLLYMARFCDSVSQQVPGSKPGADIFAFCLSSRYSFS